MAHFALVLDGLVTNVITMTNETIDNLPFPESEPVGVAFIATLPDLSDQPGTWWQGSYNDNFRGIYPGIGYTFDGVNFASPYGPVDPADITSAPEPDLTGKAL